MSATRAHLTALPSPADERRAWDRRAASLKLPGEIRETAVRWERWEPPLQMTHVSLDCVYCPAKAADAARTVGLVTLVRRGKPPRPLRRFFAYGCLSCGAIDVYDWYPDGPGVLKMPDFEEAWTNRPETEPGEQLALFDEPAGATHE